MDEGEMLRWEWTDVHSLSSLWRLRGDRGRMIWTPVEELDVCVLTLLSPLGTILWNLSEHHRAFTAGRSRFSIALSAREDATQRLDALCADLGVPRTSFLAYVPFGALTQPFGERYAPATLDPDYFLLARRHASIAVPSACRDAVSRYFHRLATVFGESAFMACPEDLVVEGSHEPEDTRLAISLGADAMSALQRRQAAAWLSHALEDEVPLATLGYVFGTFGAELSLHLDAPSSDRDAMEDVLRLRTRLLVDRASLPAVERAKASLETRGWESLALADLREELRGQLDARLCPFPVVQTDPFGAWRPGGYR